jgi:hypothetical protein
MVVDTLNLNAHLSTQCLNRIFGVALLMRHGDDATIVLSVPPTDRALRSLVRNFCVDVTARRGFSPELM